MLITDPKDYRIGDIFLTDGKGPVFTILSWLLGRFDKDWRKLKRKPWHVGFLTRSDKINGVISWRIGEARGEGGVQENRLTDLKNPYQVFRWFDTPPDEAKVGELMKKRCGDKYDPFWGYLFVILWFFIKWFPRIINRRWMCWEFLYYFCVQMGKPMDEEYEYPLITIMMVKLGYPGY